MGEVFCNLASSRFFFSVTIFECIHPSEFFSYPPLHSASDGGALGAGWDGGRRRTAQSGRGVLPEKAEISWQIP